MLATDASEFVALVYGWFDTDATESRGRLVTGSLEIGEMEI